MEKQKVLIEVETSNFEDGTILVFNNKTKTFETKTVDELIEKFITGIEKYNKSLEKELNKNKATYKSKLQKLNNLLNEIEKILGGGE